MNCRICNRECKPLFTLDNQPAGVQHLPDKPDSKGITLNVVQCTGCGLVQLDNEPVWYWKESINPNAKPAMRRPPMSIGAAEPRIEWVELAVKEMRTRNRMAALVVWNWAARRIIVVSRK